MVIKSTNHKILSLASALKQGDNSTACFGLGIPKEMMNNTGTRRIKGETCAEQGRDYSRAIGDSQETRRSKLREKFRKE